MLEGLMVSRKVSWLMIGLYLHSLIGSVWAHEEAVITHFYLRPHKAPASLEAFELALEPAFDFHITRSDNSLDFKGQLCSSQMEVEKGDPASFPFERIAHKITGSWAYIFNSPELGTFYVNHDGAVAYKGLVTAKDAHLTLDVGPSLLLEDVHLKELKVLGSSCTFRGTNAIDEMHVAEEAGKKIYDPTFHLPQGASLKTSRLALENLSFIHQGTLLSPGSLDVTLGTGSLIHQGQTQVSGDCGFEGHNLLFLSSPQVKKGLHLKDHGLSHMHEDLVAGAFTHEGQDLTLAKNLRASHIHLQGTGKAISHQTLIAHDTLTVAMETVNKGSLLSEGATTVSGSLTNQGGIESKTLELQKGATLINESPGDTKPLIRVKGDLTYFNDAILHNKGLLEIQGSFREDKSARYGYWLKELLNAGEIKAKSYHVSARTLINEAQGIIEGHSGWLSGTFTNKGSIKGEMRYCGSFLNEGEAQFESLFGSSAVVENRGTLYSKGSYSWQGKISAPTVHNYGQILGDNIKISKEVKDFHHHQGAHIQAKSLSLEQEEKPGSCRLEGTMATDSLTSKRIEVTLGGLLDTSRFAIEGERLILEEGSLLQNKPGTQNTLKMTESITNGGKLLFAGKTDLETGVFRNQGHVQNQEPLNLKLKTFENKGAFLGKKDLNLEAGEIILHEGQKLLSDTTLTLKTPNPITFQGDTSGTHLSLSTPHMTLKPRATVTGTKTTALEEVKAIETAPESQITFHKLTSQGTIDHILNGGQLLMTASDWTPYYLRHVKKEPVTALKIGTLENREAGQATLKDIDTGIESVVNHGDMTFGSGTHRVKHTLNHHNRYSLGGMYYIYGDSYVNKGTLISSDGNYRISVTDKMILGNVKVQGDLTIRHRASQPLGNLLKASTLDCQGTLTIKGTDLTLNADDVFTFKNLCLILDTFTNRGGALHTTGLLNLWVNHTFVGGASNDALGLLTSQGPLTLSAHTIDARFAKIFGKEETKVTARTGDVLVGEKKLVPSSFPNPVHVYYLRSTSYNKPSLNGSYISSDHDLSVEAPQGNIFVDYGNLYSKGNMYLKSYPLHSTTPLRGAIRLTSAKIQSSGAIDISGDHLLLTVPDLQQVYSDWAHYVVRMTLETGDKSSIQTQGCLYLNLRDIHTLSSDILAGKSIFIRDRLLQLREDNLKNSGLTVETRGLMCRHRHIYGENHGNEYPCRGSQLDSYRHIPTIKAGEQIYMNRGDVTLTGTMNAPIIKIDVNRFLGTNTSLSRTTTLPTTSLIIDLAQVAKTHLGPQGFMKRLPSGRVTTDVALPQQVYDPTNLLYLNQEGPFTSAPRMFIDDTPLSFILQKALSDYAGTLNLGGKKGKKLIESLQQTGVMIKRENPQALVTTSDAQDLAQSFIAYAVKNIEGAIYALPQLVIAPQDVNPYQDTGDISSSKKIKINTKEDLTLQNNRVVAGKIKLHSEGTLTRETQKYWVTTHLKDGVIHEEKAYPQQQVMATKSHAQITSVKDYKEVGAQTIARRDLVRGSKEGDTKIESLDLKRIEERTEKKRGVFSSTTTTTTTTSHQVIGSSAWAGRDNTLKGGKTLSLTGSCEQAGRQLTCKSPATQGQGVASMNRTTSSSTTSGFLGSQRSGGHQESVSFSPLVISAPKVVFKGGTAELKGAQINADVLVTPETPLISGSQVVTVTGSSYSTSNHLFGHEAKGEDFGQEVAFPTTIQATEIQGSVVEEKPILRSWRTAWGSSSGLSLKETAAFLSIVTAIATQGWGTALAGEIGITSAFAQGCLSGTVSGLSSSVVAGTYSHHGNILGALEDTVSSQALRSLAVSALTAGAMGHANLSQGPDFIDHLKKSTLQAALNTGLKIAIEGADPGAALRQGLLSAGVNTLSGWGASEIGLKRASLDYVSHKALHGVVGGLKAKLLGKDVASGAAGAMLAEVLGEALVVDANTRLPELYAQAAQKGAVDREAIEKQYASEVEFRLDLARVFTAGAALLGGLEVETAYDTADNALKHNLLPTLIWGAVAVGGAAWTAYDVYDTYVTEGVEAAVQKLALEGTIMVVAGGTFKVAGKFYPTAQLAWTAALKHSPMLKTMVSALEKPLAKASHAFHQADAATSKALQTMAGKAKEKVLGKGTEKATEKMAAVGVNKGPYSPQGMRAMLEKNNPGAKIESSTLPDSKLKNVKLAGQRHPETGIVFDNRGFPIFDDVAKFDTRIGREIVRIDNPKLHMREATRNLREQINLGEIDKSRFNTEQLTAIKEGRAKIPEYTWHHHQDVGRMQLIPTEVHKMTGHIGGMETNIF